MLRMQLHKMAACDNCIFLSTISCIRVAASELSMHLENAEYFGVTNPELEIDLKLFAILMQLLMVTN